MGEVGRKPMGFAGRTVMLPPELWERVERYAADHHLSSTAEALRVLLWRVLDEVEAERPARPKRKAPR